MNRPRPRLLAACLFLALAGGVRADEGAARPPAGATRAFSIADYGAVADGKAMNTDAFRKAIEACSATGGGRVIVPAGTYLTGPIRLMSKIDLHLEEGAIILFSKRFEDYPLLVNDFEGHQTVTCTSPISGDQLHDVSITGKGILDGQGDAWRPVQKKKLTDEQWQQFLKSGGATNDKGDTWYPSQAAMEGAKTLLKQRQNDKSPRVEDYARFRELLRPCLVLLSNSKNIRFQGVTFRNSPDWNLHLLLDDDITVEHVTLFNPGYAQNGDAIDLDSCRNVLVANCDINAGDDDICLKSGRDEEGRKRGRPTENVTVRNCTVGTGHGGVAIGSEMSGGVRNVFVTNCIFRGTDAGLRFKTTRGRGGVVENINISNIAMYDIHGPAIIFDMYYQVKNPQPEPVSERTPIFRQFKISNVTCEGAKTAMQIRGLPELPIEELTLENLRLTADKGAQLIDAKDVTLRDVHIQSVKDPAFQTTNVQNLTVERLTTQVAKPAAAVTEDANSKPQETN